MTNTFDIKTVKGYVVRTLFNNLKSILSDINIVITQDGLRIVEQNDKVLVDLSLSSSNFEQFITTKPKVVMCLNVNKFFYVLKSVKSNDILSLYMTEADQFHLNIVIENADEKRHHIIALYDIITDKDIPKISYANSFNLSSKYLKNTVKETKSIGDHVSLCLTDKHLFFTVRDESELVIEKRIDLQLDETIRATYSTNLLSFISKNANLSNEVTVSVMKDLPLKLSYGVGGLGSLDIYLQDISP